MRGIRVKTRYLTKSRFKLAMECPTKLFYTGKKDYANQKLENSFLASLAEGGFQVEELAKAYYPDGYDIKTLDYEQALQETNTLLKQENCVIFEAAIMHENFFIRVDILVKEGNDIKLIEVKSSSTDEDTEATFLNNKQNLLTEWKPYVHDVTFQYYVAEKALADYDIIPYLMLVDKNAKAPTYQLNQKFKIIEEESGRRYATLSRELSEDDVSERLLVNIPVKSLCQRLIEEDTYLLQGEHVSFANLVKRFADDYEADRVIQADISRSCKDCEFYADHTEMKNGLKSGYHACFKKNLQWEETDFEEDTIFDLRNFRKTDEFIAENKIKFSDLTAEDVGTEPDQTKSSSEKALNQAERRWLQVKKAQNNDTSFYINKEKLRAEMKNWTYPLHFIDFETAQPAIPFNKGESPYSFIAFQFSHHMVYEDGTIEHKSEYLDTTIGINPNIDFVRQLKKALENDEGTIFRYSHHENTILNKIYDQLEANTSSIEDKDELQRFILDITKREGKVGKRNMVDLCALVEKNFYDPYMKGSTSIKVVLPAILNGSDYIQEKYSKPIYGAKDGIKSLNFTDKVWVKIKDGQVTDPYQVLAQSSTQDDVSKVINDGGAAMAAYEQLQFADIPIDERKNVEAEMLKYCELDTLAMVLIYEAWVDIIYKD